MECGTELLVYSGQRIICIISKVTQDGIRSYILCTMILLDNEILLIIWTLLEFNQNWGLIL